MQRKHLYLVLTLAGTVLPMTAFVPWLTLHGLDGHLFLRDLLANGISRFFAWDVLLSAISVLAFARTAATRTRLWTLAGTVLLGVSVGLPLLLYLREREAERARGGTAAQGSPAA